MIVPCPRRLIGEQADRAQQPARTVPGKQTHPVLENLAAECRSRLAMA